MSNRTFSDTEASGPCLPARDAYGFLLSLKNGHPLSVFGDGGLWDETSQVGISQDDPNLIRSGSALHQ